MRALPCPTNDSARRALFGVSFVGSLRYRIRSGHRSVSTYRSVESAEMATQKPPRGSATRERLMQAADRLWGERGVRGASLDDIAREASVTKPTV